MKRFLKWLDWHTSDEYICQRLGIEYDLSKMPILSILALLILLVISAVVFGLICLFTEVCNK